MKPKIRRYCAYVGGKGRYYAVQTKDRKWKNIYKTGKAAEQEISEMVERDELLDLTVD